MKQRIKTYKFWVSFSAAIIIFLKALGKLFQFEIEPEIVDGVVMGFCGVLVVLGFVTKDGNEDENNQNTEEENNKENTQKNNDENINNKNLK